MAETQLLLWSDGEGGAVASPPVHASPAGDRRQSAVAAVHTVTATPCDEAIPRLVTSGVIAEETGATPARVRHILRSRTDIRPAAYAGLTRLFRRDAVARVRHELNAIDARRASQGGPKP